MSSSAESGGLAAPGADAGLELARCLAAVDPRELPAAVVQQLMTIAVRAYGHLVEQDAGVAALAHHDAVSATDAVRAASGILKAVELETFELALWQMFGGGGR